MAISIIAIGKNKEKALQMLVDEYQKRLQAFGKCTIIEVKDETNALDEATVKKKEAKRVFEKIKDTDFVVLLDLHGTMLDSIGFSKKIEQWQMQHSSIVFVIAGSLGPDESLVKRANFRWKLSDLTFTHLMTRVLLIEQIYRAFMIISGRNYHK